MQPHLLDNSASLYGLKKVNAPVTLQQLAVEQLRVAIVSGELKPGTILKDAEVARQIGLSATPIREALLQLSLEGLVDIQPNRKKMVALIDHQAMVELLRVQRGLWSMGYAWGAKNIGKEELEHLKQAKDAHMHAVLNADITAAVMASNAFHHVILQASNNRELVRLAANRLPLIERYVNLCMPDVAGKATIEPFEAAYQAFVKGDPDAAITIVTELTDMVLEVAVRLQNNK